MPKKASKQEYSILEQLLNELRQEIDATEGKVSRKITKGQALIKSMVNEALKGDQRMVANILKFIEKIDALQTVKKEEEKLSETDEEIIYRYYNNNKEHIEQELQKRHKI